MPPNRLLPPHRHVSGYNVRDVTGTAAAFAFEEASVTSFLNFEPYLRRVLTGPLAPLEGLLAKLTSLPGALQCWLLEGTGKVRLTHPPQHQALL